MGELQQLEIRCAADGAQYGLRAGSEKDQGEHAQSGLYLHQVRTSFNSLASSTSKRSSSQSFMIRSSFA